MVVLLLLLALAGLTIALREGLRKKDEIRKARQPVPSPHIVRPETPTLPKPPTNAQADGVVTVEM